jgi:hypothetical protein
MTYQEIAEKLHELKVKQGKHFQKKKEQRNAEELSAIRTEMNELKGQARTMLKQKRQA